MDRLPRLLVVGVSGLGLLLSSSGCRATRPEVPPGRPFTRDGQQRKAIEFSSDGHPVSASASSQFMPSGVGGSNLASGIGSNSVRPEGAAYGAPPGSYGPPGTAGMNPPATSPIDPATERASSPPMDMLPPAGLPPMDAPTPASTTPTGPRADRPVPNQVIQPSLETPGGMGSPDQMPSPN